MTPRGLTHPLALSILLLLPTACYREVSEATATPAAARYTGTALWTIDGIRPGQTLSDVKKKLGEPGEFRGSGVRAATWAKHGTVVTVDRDDQVLEVMGFTLQAGDQRLLSAGMSENEVTQTLGPGKVQKSYQSGSGVISFGRKHTGTTLIYEQSGVRFELAVEGEAAGHYLARFTPPKK